MALAFDIIPYVLRFKFEARTSRGSLRQHKTWFLKVWDEENPERCGYGECAPFEGLSPDDRPDFGQILQDQAAEWQGQPAPADLEAIAAMSAQVPANLPAIRFGLETALRDWYYGGCRKIFDTPFYNDHKSIDINGLVWMGSKEEMLDRLEMKIVAGFDGVKIKIGSLDFADELEVIRHARELLGNSELCIRVDANGAYDFERAREVMRQLRRHNVHSIEQPIKPRQYQLMRQLCEEELVPVALDEELIGVTDYAGKKELLTTIRPQYIVLKPTLLGGFVATNEWIDLADEMGIGWWITSALESNIGLNAICQFTSQFPLKMHQGLGTGELYENNIPSPLKITNGCIHLDKTRHWYIKMAEHQPV